MYGNYVVFHADKTRLVEGKRVLVEVKRYQLKSWITHWQARHPDADIWIKRILPDGKVEWTHEETESAPITDEHGLMYDLPYTYTRKYTPAQVNLLFVVLDSFQ